VHWGGCLVYATDGVTIWRSKAVLDPNGPHVGNQGRYRGRLGSG